MFKHTMLAACAAVAFTSAPVMAAEKSEIELLREQVELMRQEIQQLKRQQQDTTARAVHAQREAHSAATQANAARTESYSVKQGLPDLDGVISTNHDYADTMLNWQNDVTGKARRLLQYRQSGALQADRAYISGIFKGSLMAEWSDTEDKFGILSRFPGQHSGSSGSRFVVNNAALGTTATVGDWVNAYLQLEYTETEYPGQDDLQMRKAFVTVGNLNESPLYAYFGRNTIDFGDMDSYNPFTHTVVNHYFQAVSDDPIAALGYYDGNWDIVATAINGGRQMRVADHPDTNHIKNFALNANYTFDLGQQQGLRFGGSYLHSTIYNSLTPHHTTTQAGVLTDRERVGAAGGVIEYTSPSFDMMGEFVTTTDEWQATDHAVWAATAQAEYRFDAWERPHAVSLVYGHGEQGSDGTEWERVIQGVLGYETELFPHFYVGAEYVYNQGWVPLINIQQVADRDVRNHSIVAGGRFVF